MRTGKVLLGALAGLASGALAGILFAPEKGSKTRKQIRDTADDFMDGLKSQFDDLRDLLAKKIEHTKKEGEELIYKGKAHYEDAKKDVQKAASNIKQDNPADIKY